MLKTVLHNIFVEFVIHFIQDSLINRKFKRTAFVTLEMSLLSPSLLNKKKKKSFFYKTNTLLAPNFWTIVYNMNVCI